MLEAARAEQGVSTGLDALDAVLGGLYWGDNVVWQLDAAPAEPFYNAIARRSEDFDTRTVVSLGASGDVADAPGLSMLRAGPGTTVEHPADLLSEIRRQCRPGGRRLLLFASLDTMVQAWGSNGTRGFFARCCPLLLDVGAIAYWSMSVRETPSTVTDTVESVTQCVLRVDEHRIRVAKAEGRSAGALGSVLHWRDEDGQLALEPADVIARVAASLRMLRRSRELTQHELAALAGVTASAISQAERAERGLSLATLARLSEALGLTIDDLLHGEHPEPYRVGRRTDDPLHGVERTITLLGEAASELRIDLVHLDPREAGGPAELGRGLATEHDPCKGIVFDPCKGIVAVASGLIQVQIAGRTPGVRAGEVLVADSEQVEGWRNIGETEAVLFWIVVAAPGPRRRVG